MHVVMQIVKLAFCIHALVFMVDLEAHQDPSHLYAIL